MRKYKIVYNKDGSINECKTPCASFSDYEKRIKDYHSLSEIAAEHVELHEYKNFHIQKRHVLFVLAFLGGFIGFSVLFRISSFRFRISD